MRRPDPPVETPDVFFDYLIKKFHQGSWDSNPVRHDFSLFVNFYVRHFEPLPKKPLAAFFRAKAVALRRAGDDTAIERLRAHVRRYFAQDLKLKRREWVRLVDELTTSRNAPSTTYVFKREGDYDERQIVKLPAAEQKQFLIAAGNYLGGSFRAIPAFFKKVRSELDGDDIDVRRWRISIDGKPKTAVYEMWTFLVDNGSVFPIGKATPVAEMIQGAFQVTKSNADLAADLQAVVPF